MAALAYTIALHDPKCGAHINPRNPCLGKLFCITDVEAFVQATINRSRRVYGLEEREELVGEGLRITYDLASRFDPHREGYEQGGRLCGFVAKYLTLKLEDAYHRLHPEHQLRTDPETGKRSYAYGEKAVSLEALAGEDGETGLLRDDTDGITGDGVTVEQIAEKLGLTSQQFNATVGEIRALAQKLGSWGHAATVATLSSLLRDRCEERYETGLRVAGALVQGLTLDKDIADELGITLSQVREARADLEPIAQRLRTLNQT